MENASKALIMAASVLLGVMIISIGVVLFRTFSDFSADSAQKMADKQISEWNNTYLKYYGEIFNEVEKKPEPIKVTAHDIISVINSARQNNINYFGDDWPQLNEINDTYYYVKVKIDGANKVSGLNAEKWDDYKKLTFLKNNSLDEENNPIYFVCTNVEISSVTKRVWSISFKIISN